ncbi:Outer membrane usher protein FimD precursor [Aquimixticola soesokkakensis]|uniref:Outer membrane usher protein FimD n=1 Tax=Aquimixticola soesokkakensis TaxID=1519096 RepID=A0A1Y5SLH8_9RHOB|nr:fimbria/pilus outer membrane usher protein [Aquimixticola soesokkakensis]SLN43382.1 Outer membrane usher protein FimD precursor [Aquimixticola soesokkakensis]
MTSTFSNPRAGAVRRKAGMIALGAILTLPLANGLAAQDLDAVTRGGSGLEASASITGMGALSGDRVPLFLAVSINGKDTNLVAEFSGRLDGSDLRSTSDELQDVGLRIPGSIAQKIIAGQILDSEIALSEFEGLTYVYDSDAQRVLITAPDAALLPHVISASGLTSPQAADHATGAVLNYALTGAHYAPLDGALVGSTTLAGSFEGWIYSPYGTLSSTGFYSQTLRSGASDTGTPSFVRQETAFTKDFADKAMTLTIGDYSTQGPDWTRSVRLGGLAVSRNFSLRSDLVTDQRLSYSGAAAVPSSVDVFIENNRIYSGEVDEGPFRLEDLPVKTGAGDAEVVIQGADGRVRHETVSFFNSGNLMKAGMIDYSLAAGRARQAFGLESAQYGDSTILSGSLRYGVTPLVTVDGHFEASDTLKMAGAGLTAVPLALGELSIAAAASDYDGTSGGFVEMGMHTQIGMVDINAKASRSDGGFADLAYVTGVNYLGADTLASSGSLLEVPLAQDVLSIGIPVTREQRKLGLSYVRSERENSADRLVAASYGTTFNSGRGAFSMSGSYNLDTDESQMSFGMSLKLGAKTFARATSSSDEAGGTSRELSVSRTMGSDVGDWGYQGQVSLDDGATSFGAKGEYRASLAEFAAGLQRSEDGYYIEGQVDGALVLTGGALALGGRIEDSFAVVDTGVADMPIYLQNREVARTGRSGRALVPGLNSYASNRVSVEVSDLPMPVSMGVTAMDVVPARRTGALVDFKGENTAAGVMVVLRDARGQVVPAGAPVTVNGKSAAAFVGYDGQTWIAAAKASNQLEVGGATPCHASFAFAPTGALQEVVDPVECL